MARHNKKQPAIERKTETLLALKDSPGELSLTALMDGTVMVGLPDRVHILGRDAMLAIGEALVEHMKTLPADWDDPTIQDPEDGQPAWLVGA